MLPLLPKISFLPCYRTAAFTTADEALFLFKSRLLHRHQENFSYAAHAAIVAIKSSSYSHFFLHSHLLKANLVAHVYVATALLNSYALRSLKDARRLFDEISNRNTVTFNTMITCYSRNGDVTAARKLFNEMLDRDIISWCAMIGGYMESGNYSQGLALFRELMHAGKFKPDAMLLVTLLAGCARTGAMRSPGKSVHAYVVKHGMEINVQLATSLIDMYAKSGCLINAFRVFEGVPCRNVMHWTAMICGLASHGRGEDAVAFFESMQRKEVKPNALTFTGVLNACCHSGLVDKGKEYFGSMVKEFGIKPSVHHYGCMVDLFAKVGMLEDAYSIIQSMKLEPNIVIWTSFLAACKTYKNFEIAEKAIKRVLSMAAPEADGGVYSLISDLYAMDGKWEDAEKVRRLMDNENVKKNRGSAFI